VTLQTIRNKIPILLSQQRLTFSKRIFRCITTRN
jgi:hypothetical protein